MTMYRVLIAASALVVLAAFGVEQASAQDKPNIVVIWGDDIGQFNISAYNRGMMGYRTPNIDRIATQGALFTDWYGQQRCRNRIQIGACRLVGKLNSHQPQCESKSESPMVPDRKSGSRH